MGRKFEAFYIGETPLRRRRPTAARLALYALLLLVALHGTSRLWSVFGRNWSRVDDAERDSWEHTRRIMAGLELRQGLDVGDFGAGTGYFSFRVAPLVAPGRVFTSDVDVVAVGAQWVHRWRKGADNVHPRLISSGKVGFEPASLDRILVSNVYPFQTCTPGHTRSLLMQFHQALRPGGLVLIFQEVVRGVDWHARQGLPVDCVEPSAREVADLAAPWLVAERVGPGARAFENPAEGRAPGYLLVLRRPLVPVAASP
jgi:SAM-dependent methyltransferase